MKPIHHFALFYVGFITALVVSLSLIPILFFGGGLIAGLGMAFVLFILIILRRAKHRLFIALALALALAIGFLLRGDANGLTFTIGAGAALLLLVLANETCYEDGYAQINRLPQK